MSPEAYEGFLAMIDYNDAYMLAEICGKPLDDSPETNYPYGLLDAERSIKIFDIGLGTGLVGRHLTAHGFTHVDGGDASAEFCRAAESTNYYQDVHEICFGIGTDQLPADWIGAYDVVTCAGCFLEGHIPCAGFEDAVAMLKVGGHFMTSLR